MKTRELAAKWGILQADLNAALASHGYIQKDKVQLKRYRSMCLAG
jgi:phage antirepressor YoqD-like protein